MKTELCAHNTSRFGHGAVVVVLNEVYGCLCLHFASTYSTLYTCVCVCVASAIQHILVLFTKHWSHMLRYHIASQTIIHSHTLYPCNVCRMWIECGRVSRTHSQKTQPNASSNATTTSVTKKKIVRLAGRRDWHTSLSFVAWMVWEDLSCVVVVALCAKLYTHDIEVTIRKNMFVSLSAARCRVGSNTFN